MERDTEKTPGSARGETAGKGVWAHPLDFIAEDHMREREVCALIDRLVVAAPVSDDDIGRMLSFLVEHLPHHLLDEEVDLFPLMLQRCDPEDEIDKVIDKLCLDHAHATADAPEIVAILRVFARHSAPLCERDRGQMAAFAHHSRRHLILENAIILPIARARLTQGDLATMKSHMLERRGLPQ
ncbi:hemerythrin domain-containing protein [Antarctobacter heliothermus]|uniref:Hemerythrin-like domain-containing protein n=1 Tax=Antarctobacter heliothermus TaxID=74033 RepID=A0A239I1M7_9RHOB|nr:hemerythrin domain-containing protein [Antarctobacter heliothermus]SNS87391.1 Hemerythrin-like domain-containing protein [Antarctobacter heliothermus]